jgi:hypothetical protein
MSSYESLCGTSGQHTSECPLQVVARRPTPTVAAEEKGRTRESATGAARNIEGIMVGRSELDKRQVTGAKSRGLVVAQRGTGRNPVVRVRAAPGRTTAEPKIE